MSILSVGSGPYTNSKDWKNWVTLHGYAKGVEADILEMGEAIGVRCNNSFQVLARGVGRGGLVDSGVRRVKEARKGVTSRV